jgi:hypothetical protein
MRVTCMFSCAYILMEHNARWFMKLTKGPSACRNNSYNFFSKEILGHPVVKCGMVHTVYVTPTQSFKVIWLQQTVYFYATFH